MLGSLYPLQDKKRLPLIYLLFAFVFPQVLVGINAGQVTFLVFFGLVACLWMIKREQWFWAGAILILTTIKPHLVILQFTYLLFYMIQKRKYEGWAGFFATGIIFLVILFTLRPQLINDLVGLLKIAPTKWSTPTIGGLLSYLGITEAGRYLVVLLLPLPFILGKHQESISVEFSIALLTLLNVPATFFGWSYDQTILLIPIAQTFQWLHRSKTNSLKIGVILAIVIALGINYSQRVTGIYEVYYVWVSLFWCLIFAITWFFAPGKIKHHE